MHNCDLGQKKKKRKLARKKLWDILSDWKNTSLIWPILSTPKKSLWSFTYSNKASQASLQTLNNGQHTPKRGILVSNMALQNQRPVGLGTG
jgi:hypothetical protein